jgi:hypothetical protein
MDQRGSEQSSAMHILIESIRNLVGSNYRPTVLEYVAVIEAMVVVVLVVSWKLL